MIESEKMEEGGVKIVDVDFVFHGRVTQFIGGAVGLPAFDAGSGQPQTERASVVISARGVAGDVAIGGRRSAELAAPDDERVLEQPFLFQVAEERGDGFVGFGGFIAQGVLEVVVMIPAAVPDLDEAHAFLEQAPGDEHLAAEWRLAVEIAGFLGFFGDVERIGRFHLHLIGKLVGLEARFELSVLLEVLGVNLIELVQEIELAALLRERDVFALDVLDEFFDLRAGGVDGCSLESAGKKCRTEVVGADTALGRAR